MQEYEFPLPVPGDRVTVRFRAAKGKIADFAVQYFSEIDGIAYEIVRYDGSHGHPHRDTLDHRGRVVRKTWLDTDHNTAMTDAIDDLTDHWERYREDFRRGMRQR